MTKAGPGVGGWNMIPRIWHWFLARFHLSEHWVCELSKDCGLWDDYHDYQDDELGQPWHFVTLKCKRCGKEFCI